MRVNEQQIDYNALQLINETTNIYFSNVGKSAAATLGEIEGIIRLANVMKEVLKA